MRPEELEIVFDKYPPSAVGKYLLTVGKPYTALRQNEALGLYSLVDDAGVAFNVSTYGAGYTNGGYWHIVGQAGC
ncbi:hypothetical protein [Pseudomonas putida]|uniref:hypothetical protein n=1 Tax=Pseudomonas putida TaxID=303 RepID=UPI00036DF030|nr:hypothetical protein [Pseudomonas putida]